MPLEPSIASALDPVVKATGDLWGDLMTKLLGTIETPDGTLLLDHDVPPIPGSRSYHPALSPLLSTTWPHCWLASTAVAPTASEAPPRTGSISTTV